LLQKYLRDFDGCVVCLLERIPGSHSTRDIRYLNTCRSPFISSLKNDWIVHSGSSSKTHLLNGTPMHHRSQAGSVHVVFQDVNSSCPKHESYNFT
jgi:hypothetical protein